MTMLISISRNFVGITASGGAVQSTRSKRIADMMDALEDSGWSLSFLALTSLYPFSFHFRFRRRRFPVQSEQFWWTARNSAASQRAPPSEHQQQQCRRRQLQQLLSAPSFFANVQPPPIGVARKKLRKGQWHFSDRVLVRCRARQTGGSDHGCAAIRATLGRVELH